MMTFIGPPAYRQWVPQLVPGLRLLSRHQAAATAQLPSVR